MKLEELKTQILGTWKFADGRFIEFINPDEYILKDEKNVPFYKNDPNHRIFYNVLDDNTGRIIISMPLLCEPLALVKMISKYQFIYDSYDVDNSVTEYTLIRINN